MKVMIATSIAILLGTLGCGEPASFQATSPAAEAPQPAVQPEPETEPAPEPAGLSETQANVAAGTVDEDVRVAKPSDGKRGQDYGGGMITEPLRQNFMIRNRIAFLTIENAMKMFKALNDRPPESHEEFMEKIIKENGVSLPDLRSGEDYFYDPEREELMIRRQQ